MPLQKTIQISNLKEIIRFEKYIFILLDFLFINIETSPINILSNIIQREETM